MNCTPAEKIILKEFRKHLSPDMFAVYVQHLLSSSSNAPFFVGIYPSRGMYPEPLFTGNYASQQEVLDKAEEVCMMVVFGVQGP